MVATRPVRSRLKRLTKSHESFKPTASHQADQGSCIETFESAALPALPSAVETHSLVAWADEIFVVDSQSTDGSQQIAKRYGRRSCNSNSTESGQRKKSGSWKTGHFGMSGSCPLLTLTMDWRPNRGALFLWVIQKYRRVYADEMTGLRQGCCASISSGT